MKFKDFLELNELYTSAYEELIMRCSIPIGPKMMDRLGYSYDDEVYHLTNYKFLPKLKKMQGTKKSISCFTKGSHELASLPSEPDVLVKLKGNILIDSESDMWTLVDKQGRRWISIDEAGPRKLPKSSKKLKFYIEGIRDKILQRNGIELYDIKREWEKLSGKTKAKIIKEYIDAVEKYIQEGGYKLLNQHFKDDITFSYNELVVNEIDILGVFAIEGGFYTPKKDDIEEIGLRFLGTKTFQEISKIA